MQNSSEVSHVRSRHILHFLIPIIHDPALPLTVRSISCSDSHMVFWIGFPCPARQSKNWIKPIWNPTPFGSFIVNGHGKQVISSKKKPKRKKHQKSWWSFPPNHRFRFLDPLAACHFTECCTNNQRKRMWGALELMKLHQWRLQELNNLLILKHATEFNTSK